MVLTSLILLHVEDRADVQAADRGMGVPSAAWCRDFSKMPVRPGGVLGKVRQLDGAQSSTKDTGFPSAFIDIMMLRPDLRSFRDGGLGGRCRSTRTTPPQFLPSCQTRQKPRSPMASSSKLSSFACRFVVLHRPSANSTRSNSVSGVSGRTNSLDRRAEHARCRGQAQSWWRRPVRRPGRFRA